MQVSVILTIGSALTRAEQDGTEVAVLVQGEWFRGHVRGLDGHGLMLDDGQGHDLLVRLEHVAVLRIDHSGGALYLWATRDQACWETVDWFADRGILVAPGDFYGAAGARHVRVAITATDERGAAAVSRLSEGV